MTTIDTNVSNYTLSELIAIAGINVIEPKEIIEKTDKQIKRFKTSKPEISVFFEEIQSQLLHYAEGLEYKKSDSRGKIIVEGFGSMSNEAIYPAGEEQVNEWYTNQNLTQSDSNQTDKITDREQKTQTFGNQHAPMDREQIATTDTYNLPVKQDSLNPNLKNTISRFVNLDSQFRQYTNGLDSTSTEYTCDLSDTLKNALSLSLYSYQIPFSWYTIDKAYGNTCFWIVDSSANKTIPVSVPSGNYSQDAFVIQLNQSFLNAGFTFTTPTNPVDYNANSGIITLYLFFN